jgi:hypothetical protein
MDKRRSTVRMVLRSELAVCLEVLTVTFGRQCLSNARTSASVFRSIPVQGRDQLVGDDCGSRRIHRPYRAIIYQIVAERSC